MYLNYSPCFLHYYLSRWWHTQLLSLKERREKETDTAMQLPPNHWPTQHSISPRRRNHRWPPGIRGLKSPSQSAHEIKSKLIQLPRPDSVRSAHHRVSEVRGFLHPAPLPSLRTLQVLQFLSYGRRRRTYSGKRGNQPHLPSSAAEAETERKNAWTLNQLWSFDYSMGLDTQITKLRPFIFPKGDHKTYGLAQYSSKDRERTRPHWVTESNTEKQNKIALWSDLPASHDYSTY